METTLNDRLKLGVFLDGKQIAPHDTSPVYFDNKGVQYEFTWYLFKIGNWKVRVYIDNYSRIELNSQSFFDDDDLTEEWDGKELLFSAWIRNSFILDCVLVGEVSFTETHLEKGYFDNSNLYNQMLRIAAPIRDLRCVSSTFEDFLVSDSGRFDNVNLVNTTIQNDKDDHPGLYYEVLESSFTDCSIIGCGKHLTYYSNLNACSIVYDGYFGLDGVMLNNVSINTDHIDIQSAFEFFTISFPNTTLHVFTNRCEEFTVCENGGACVNVHDPEFDEKLKSLILEDREDQDDLVIYVKDCLASRMALLKVIKKSRWNFS